MQRVCGYFNSCRVRMDANYRCFDYPVRTPWRSRVGFDAYSLHPTARSRGSFRYCNSVDLWFCLWSVRIEYFCSKLIRLSDFNDSTRLYSSTQDVEFKCIHRIITDGLTFQIIKVVYDIKHEIPRFEVEIHPSVGSQIPLSVQLVYSTSSGAPSF